MLALALQWLWSHPLIWYPIFTALSSLAYTLLDKDSKWHAFFQTCAAAGVDLPKLQEWVKAMFTKSAPVVPLLALALMLGVGSASCLKSGQLDPKVAQDAKVIAACIADHVAHDDPEKPVAQAAEEAAVACFGEATKTVTDIFHDLISAKRQGVSSLARDAGHE